MGGVSVEFRLLGDVAAEIDGHPIELGHARQRCVLAALLVDANRIVPGDRLLDRVWGERPPQRGRATIYGYLSRLRQLFTAAGGVGIVRRPGGYVLTADPMAVDLHRFRHLIAGARAVDDGERAAALLDEALGLWRGEPFAGLDTPWLNTLRHTVTGELLAAELDRTDLALEQGRHTGLVAELTARATAHPLDERVAVQLMVALYRCGRQAGALRHYEQVRRLLADELGADPGPALRRIHRQILTADPALAAPSLARPRGPVVPRQLPAAPASFTGRTGQLASLSGVLESGPDRVSSMVISAIGGAGGIGKTWLALHWAHQHLARFPDGQLYVNLRGFDPASDPVPAAVAIRGFLDALGVPPATVPVAMEAQAALFRSWTAGKRLLIVLDNARDTAQVAPLLPGGPTCTVLVTSRHALPGLVTLHGARSLVLDVLPDAEAEQLLTRQLGADRVAAEPEPVAALIRYCAGLPLALGIVAARAALLPELPLAVLAKELRDAAARLDALDAGELAANLRAVLSGSHRALTPEAAHVFALLGLAPGPDIGLPAAVSLTALPTARARALLGELVTAHLVQEHVPGRYRLHDLVRLYACERAGRLAPDHRRAAVHRVLDHYLHTAHDADRALDPHRDPLDLPPHQPHVVPERVAGDGALAWFTTEHAALLAAVHAAAGDGFDRLAWQLAWTLTTFFDRRGHWHDLVATHRTALAAARRLTDRAAQAYAHRGLGRAYTWLRRYDRAYVHLRLALLRYRTLGDNAGQATAHRSLARLFTQQGRHRDALPHDQRAHELHLAAGNRLGQATSLNAIGWHRAHLGDYQQARSDCQRALSLYRAAGDRLGEALTWDSLGYIRSRLRHYRLAITCYRRALSIFRELGYRYYEGNVLASLGNTHHDGGDPAAARRSWRQALAILDELGHHDADRVRASLRQQPS